MAWDEIGSKVYFPQDCRYQKFKYEHKIHIAWDRRPTHYIAYINVNNNLIKFALF